MMTHQELCEIQGGGGYLGIIAAFAGAVSFLVGFFDGLVRPFKCR